MYNFAEFIRILHKYRVVSNHSLPFLARKLLMGYAEEFGLFESEFEDGEADLELVDALSMPKISEYMSHKRDITGDFRDPLIVYGAEDSVSKVINGFVDDYMDRSVKPRLISELRFAVSEAENLLQMKKDSILMQDRDNDDFITQAFIAALFECNKYPDEKILRKNGTGSINIVCGDLFDYAFNGKHGASNIVVIPVNTGFDTHISTPGMEEYPVVSSKTIHGQWILRMKANGYTEENLYNIIQERLKRQSSTIELQNAMYPIGTIVPINYGDTCFYLLAIADFDEQKNAKSSPESIKKSIAGLIVYYDKKGLGYNLFLPLIGTGMSRSELSDEGALTLITNELKDNIKRIHGKVSIVLQPNMMKKLKIKEKSL